MPSRQKTALFMSSALASCVAIGLLGFAMSTSWSVTTFRCLREEVGNASSTAEVKLTLFVGESIRILCPKIAGDEKFQVIPLLAKIGGAPVILHGLSLFFLVLCLLCSAGSILISLYNSVSNPYETYMGPIGIYTCSSLSACLSFAVLILCVINALATTMAEDVIRDYAGSDSADLKLVERVAVMQMGYYLLIPYMGLSLLAILLIYLYEHAAYTHKREQQKPTEDAPKEIMMY